MKTGEALAGLEQIAGRCERDDDAMLFCYFSREEDKFAGVSAGMDAGDALIIVDYLIKEFGLLPAAIAAMAGPIGEG